MLLKGVFEMEAKKRVPLALGLIVLVLWGAVWVCGRHGAKPKPPATFSSLPVLSRAVSRGEGNRTNCVGDRGLKKKAYGPKQIRLDCLVDVNGHYGREIQRRFGKKRLTLADCNRSRSASNFVFEKYLQLYATTERLGHEPTDEDKARIWNGGPNGWRDNPQTPAEKRLTANAERYWQKQVRPNLEKRRRLR